MLGDSALAQHKFDGLQGDPGTGGRLAELPVDVYWPGHQLVVEYRGLQQFWAARQVELQPLGRDRVVSSGGAGLVLHRRAETCSVITETPHRLTTTRAVSSVTPSAGIRSFITASASAPGVVSSLWRIRASVSWLSPVSMSWWRRSMSPSV